MPNNTVSPLEEKINENISQTENSAIPTTPTTPKTNDDADFLTAKQLAKKLHTTRETLYSWAAEGRIPFLKIGRAYRFPASILDTSILTIQTKQTKQTPTIQAEQTPVTPTIQTEQTPVTPVTPTIQTEQTPVKEIK